MVQIYITLMEQIILVSDRGDLMKYVINFSKYINERYPDYWLFNTITADTEEEAVEKLKKKHNKNNKKVNYIISITKL